MRNARHRGVRLLELSGGRWVARYRDPVGGRTHQVDLAPLGLTNSNLRTRWAIEKAGALAKLKAQVEASGAASVSVTTEKAKDDYLATFSNEFTVRSKRPPLDSVVEFLRSRGIANVQDVTGPALSAYGNHVRRPANPHLPRTKNMWLQTVAAWLRWCRRNGWLPRVSADMTTDALHNVKVPRDPIDVLQPDGIRKLLVAADRHDATEGDDWQSGPLVLLLLLSGMRWAECAGLVWSEVDLPAKCIRLGSARTKTSAARVVTLAECPTALELLGALRLRAGKEQRVFPHATKDRCDAIRYRLRTHWGAPANCGWHQLRRTCGSLLVCAGVLGPASPFLTAKRLGHGLALAERAYLGTMLGLPVGATTIEAAGGFEAEARAIVARVAGVQAQAVAQ